MRAVRLVVIVLVALLSVLPAVRAACDLRCDGAGTPTTAPADECTRHDAPREPAPSRRGCDHLHGWPAGELTSAVIPLSAGGPSLAVLSAALVTSTNLLLAGRIFDSPARATPVEPRITLPIRV